MQVLKPLTDSPRPRNIAAFDLEGEGGAGGFISGAAVSDKGMIYTQDLNELLEFIFSRGHRGYHWYAHNLTYDLGVMLLDLPVHHEARLINGKVYKAWLDDTRGHRIYLNDSLGILGGLPLDKVGEGIGLPKYPTPTRLTKGDKDVPDWVCETHHRHHCLQCYNTRDARIVLEGVNLFQGELLRLGGQLRDTLAGTAMDLFRRRFLKQEYPTPFEYRNEWARQAYYGGRVEPFCCGLWEGVNVYDFTSLYPSVMVGNTFPHPGYLRGPTSGPPLGVIEKYEGISEVTVTVPPCEVPPLPLRRNGKLYFPIGTWEGCYTHAELRYAMGQGAVVERVHASLYSTQVCQPFNRYVETLFRIRQGLKGTGDPRQLVYKILLNSLYGKFGQRRGAGLERLIRLDEWLRDGMPRGCEWLCYDGREYLRQPVTIPRQADFVNVLWAAYITSYARIKLHQAAMQARNPVIYVDTDSIFSLGEEETGEGLGELSPRWQDVTVEIYGPKVYRITDSKGIVHPYCKGIPEDAQIEYMDNGFVTYTKPLGFWEAASHNLYPALWVEVNKRLLLTDPKREYFRARRDEHECYISRPWHVQDLPHSPWGPLFS